MNPSHYETSDKYLGSFLLSQGAILVGYKRVSPRRVVFRFVANERLHELLRLYRSVTPVTSTPLQFVAALRCLKRLARKCKLQRPQPSVFASAGTTDTGDVMDATMPDSPFPTC